MAKDLKHAGRRRSKTHRRTDSTPEESVTKEIAAANRA
jgi:hypothetical protein